MKWALRLRMGFAVAVVASALAFSPRVKAESCTNDIDCKTGSECGGQICDWLANPAMTCQPAGGHIKGQDGWCMTTSDCKCASLGATCAGFQCSFVLPSQAPGAVAAGGATGSAGGAGGGVTGSTGGTSGGTGGSVAATGGKSGTGGTAPAAGSSSSSSGGCTLAGDGAPAFGGSVLLLVGWAATATWRRRTRSRAS